LRRPPVETRLAFAGILAVLALASINMTVVGTALPRIIAELDGFEWYAWAFTAFTLASTVSLPIYGRLGDRLGRRSVLLFGIVLFTLASVAAGFSQSMLQLVAMRALQGLGGGSLMAMTWAVLGDLFTARERGAYQGITSSVFGISSVVGPIVGGLITDTLGWRWVFFVVLPFALVSYALVHRYVPRGDTSSAGPIDVTGALLLVACASPLLLALSLAGASHLVAAPTVLGLLVLAGAAGAWLIAHERRAAQPIVPFDLYRDPVVSLTSLGSLLAGAGMFAAIFYLPLYVQGVLGGSASASGLVLSPLMLGFVATTALSGWHASRTGRTWSSLVAGAIVAALGFAAAATFGTATPPALAVLVSVVIGSGLGPLMSLLVVVAQAAVPRSRLGTVTAATQFARQIGGTFGVAAFGAVIASRLGGGLAALPGVEALSAEALALVTSPNTLTDPARLARATALVGSELGVEAVALTLGAAREALAGGLRWAFGASAGLAGLALLVTLRLPRAALPEAPHRTGEEAGTLATSAAADGEPAETAGGAARLG
jgi:EmrB/QacA subfamily drug resistance transporter